MQRDRLDKATRVACELSKLVPLNQMSKEAREWVKKHREKDKARKIQEARVRKIQEKKAQALRKLSPEEKKLLGLDR